MSAFTFTAKLCGALELNKQPGYKDEAYYNCSAVAGFMFLSIKVLIPKLSDDRGNFESDLGYWEGLGA